MCSEQPNTTLNWAVSGVRSAVDGGLPVEVEGDVCVWSHLMSAKGGPRAMNKIESLWTVCCFMNNNVNWTWSVYEYYEQNHILWTTIVDWTCSMYVTYEQTLFYEQNRNSMNNTFLDDLVRIDSPKGVNRAAPFSRWYLETAEKSSNKTPSLWGGQNVPDLKAS